MDMIEKELAVIHDSKSGEVVDTLMSPGQLTATDRQVLAMHAGGKTHDTRSDASLQQPGLVAG
jgi:hypothetical protein